MGIVFFANDMIFLFFFSYSPKVFKVVLPFSNTKTQLFPVVNSCHVYYVATNFRHYFVFKVLKATYRTLYENDGLHNFVLTLAFVKSTMTR